MATFILPFLLVCFLFNFSESSILPANLTVEYLKNPHAVDSRNPRLGWKLEPISQLRPVPQNFTQKAYQILVATNTQLLVNKKPDLWDSKQVFSDRTFDVRYEGTPLEPGQTVFWTVRVWGQDNSVTAYVQPATWTQGLNQTFWTAKWIGAPQGLQKRGLSILRTEDQAVVKTHDGLKPVLYFRKEVKIDHSNINEVLLYATARGVYRIYYSGELLRTTDKDQDRYELSPGWTEYNKTIQYQVYNVTKRTEAADFVIGALVGTGWYSGYVGFSTSHSYYGNDEFLLLELHIKYKNGTKKVITSDNTWRVTFGSEIYSDILHGELMYESRNLTGWTDLNYRYSDIWLPVVTQPINKTVKLVAEASKSTTTTDVLRVKEAWKLSTNVWVYDFGVNFAGYVRIVFNNFTNNTVIKVRHAEVLYPNGSIYTENLRSALATDTYVLNDPKKRAKTLVLEPQFTYHGFRYIEVTGLSDNFSSHIFGIRIGTKGIVSSTFKTDNALVNQLFGNIVRGEISNMISIPTDCPQRDERLGWMADGQIFAPTAMYNGDMSAFYTKWMRDIREAQSNEGGFSDVAPRLVDSFDGSPAWGDAGVIMTWLMYKTYGDTQLIKDQYVPMQKWINYIAASNSDYIWRNRVNFNYGDWLNVNAQTRKEVVSTAFFAYDALLLSYMAKAINNTADAEIYAKLHKTIANAFNKNFVDQTTGKITDHTQCDYVLALAFKLLPDALIPKAVQQLVDAIKARDWHLSTGFIGTGYLLPILSEYGHSDIAYKILLQETYPSWGYTIKNNATTMWERWDGWTREKGFQSPIMNSFNHYSFGSVGRWMFQYMAGIGTDEEEVAFKKIIIQPHIGTGVNRVEASYKSIRGEIKSAWEVKNKNFNLNVTIPANTRATVILPFLKEKWEKEIGSGEWKFNVTLDSL